MKMLRIILVSTLLTFSVEATAAAAAAESDGLLRAGGDRRASSGLGEAMYNALDTTLYYLGIRRWDPLAVVVDLSPLPVRDSNTTVDEQAHANAIVKRAFKLEREGIAEKSNAKIAESVGLFHEASQYGHPEACGVMEVFCRESQHGLTPELLLTYSGRLQWWVTTLKVATASAGEDGSAARRPIVELPDFLPREHYTTPAELEAIAARERARLEDDADKRSDSTHRLSAAAASRSSSDGGGEASGDTEGDAAGGAGRDAGLRHRKPASSSPMRTRRNVDLPAPLAPTRP